MDVASRIAGLIPKILKTICLIIIFSIIIFLIVRIFIADYYPDKMKKLYPSDELVAVYEANPSLEIHKQDLRVSYDDPKYSLFMASNQFYCPETGEFQITLRYNNSTLETIAADFALDTIPAPDPSLFDYSLVDNVGNRTSLTCVWTESAMMYQYMKLVTSDLDFSTDPGWLRIEIYYKDAVDYAVDSYSRIPVYEKELVGSDTVYTLQAEDLMPW